MKKTLLAAALLAGFAGAASAQSSVTLYGIVDGGLRYQQVSRNNLDGVNNFGLAYGQQSGNRWGLKGVEDIGGGNKITFNLVRFVDTSFIYAYIFSSTAQLVQLKVRG